MTGEIVGIIGPNGSGKTTFFNVLSGIHPATSGTIRFAEHADITRLPPHRVTRCGIARTFQNQRLFNQMTVLENVLAGMVSRTRGGSAADHAGSARRARREGRGRTARDWNCSVCSASRLAPRRDRHGLSRCPMPTAGAWRSRARWPPSRACCCSTNRPPA